jgi:hypothetical protein
MAVRSTSDTHTSCRLLAEQHRDEVAFDPDETAVQVLLPQRPEREPLRPPLVETIAIREAAI